jgi:hypothetical protein
MALKIINVTKVERESYQQFIREIGFLREHQAVPGLLPLLDSHLPEQPAPAALQSYDCGKAKLAAGQSSILRKLRSRSGRSLARQNLTTEPVMCRGSGSSLMHPPYLRAGYRNSSANTRQGNAVSSPRNPSDRDP